MFPKLAGGVAIFAHEAWKRYTAFVGPIAAVGYWLGWSVVLAISGLIVGQLLQNQFYTGSEAAGSSWTHHSVADPRRQLRPQLPDLSSASSSSPASGSRTCSASGPRCGSATSPAGCCSFPLAVLIFVPYITGDWSSSNLHNNIHLD